ncbi:MFS transporter [Dictyobacter formicarum]|uniref:MFS transporter n=1 Tax=Dictyobacter formicarum TaxID=2778368 RepID=A0ABQ3VQM0_9CHLR|nr:MFS transporter [Dictyobacter formicarum]GHO87893.1 MFS transporter [Dictyobacter formicarum]
MSSVSDPSTPSVADKQTKLILTGLKEFWYLPRNVYLLLFFTLGKGFQLSIAALTLNYYVHSLGYLPDFIGIFSAMAAIGAMIGAVPVGILADRWGRKPVLLLTALLSPLTLSVLALATSAPWLIIINLLQGFVSTAYWVTNLPLLTESTTEKQRVGVLALNSFLLLGIGSLGNLLGGFIPEFVGGLLHVSAASTLALRYGVFAAASFTFIFGLPLWFLQEPRHTRTTEPAEALAAEGIEPAPVQKSRSVGLFLKLLIPDLVFTMGEGAVVALIQVYFVLRFNLLPGPLGIIFTISGLAGGIFSLTAPLFVRRWSKLRLVTTVQYLSAPLMVLIGFAPTLPLAITGEYARSFMRTLIEPVYAAFAMEQVSNRQRATLAGLYSVTWSIGFSVGPAIAGWLQTSISLSASFVYGAVCLLLAPTFLLIFFGRKNAGVTQGVEG